MILVGFRIAGALSGMGLAILLTTHLGASQFGAISQALSLAMILSLFCTLGLEAACPKFLIGNLQKSAFDQARSFILFSFGVIVIMSSLICFLTISAFGGQSELIPLAILAAPVVALTRMAAGLSMGFSNVYAAVIPRSFLRPFLFLCIIALGLLQISPFPTYLIMIGFITANILVFVCQVCILLRPLRKLDAKATGQPISFAHWRTWLEFGGIIGGAVIFIEFFQHISILIASYTLPMAEVAYLDICMKLVGFVTFGIVAVNQSYLPRNAHAFFDLETIKLQALLRQAAFIRCLASVLGMSIVYLLGPSILNLFGAEFSAAAPVLYILLWVPFLIAFFGPAANMLSITDRPIVLLKIVGATLLCLCLGGFGGGQIWGVVGVAYAVLFSWFIWGAMAAIITWQRLGVDTSFVSLLINHNQRARGRVS